MLRIARSIGLSALLPFLLLPACSDDDGGVTSNTPTEGTDSEIGDDTSQADPPTGWSPGHEDEHNESTSYDPEDGERPPNPPSQIEASDGEYADRVFVTWGRVHDAERYLVYRSVNSQAREQIATVDSDQFHYEDWQVFPGDRNYYEVSAANDFGESEPGDGDFGFADEGETGPLHAPWSVEAIPTSQSTIFLEWEAVDGAGAYGIRVAGAIEELIEPWALQAQVEQTNWEVGGLEPNTTYFFVITSLEFFGEPEGAFSEVATQTTLPEPDLEAPELEATTDRIARIDLSWTEVPGASTYQVYRLQDLVYVPWTEPMTDTEYTDTEVVPNQSVLYAVRAFGEGGRLSELSEPATGSSALIGRPHSVSAVAQGPYAVQVTWGAVDQTYRYVVLRRQTDQLEPEAIGYSEEAVFFVDRAAAPNTQYAYSVAAFGPDHLRGETSAESHVTTPALLPAPGTLIATDDALDIVTLSWSPVANAMFYRLQRAASGSGPFETVNGEVLDSEFIDEPPRLGATFYYRVIAVDANGYESAPSAVEQGRAARIEKPRNVRAQTEAPVDGIRVTWTAVHGAETYRVHRANAWDAPFSIAGIVSAAGLPAFLDTSAEPAMLYFYRVTAVSPRGNESIMETYATIGNISSRWGVTLAAPTGLRASSGTYVDQIALTWNAVSGAGEYEVFRSTNRSGPFIAVGTASEPQFVDEEVIPGVTYNYYVYAVRADRLRSTAGSNLAAGYASE